MRAFILGAVVGLIIFLLTNGCSSLEVKNSNCKNVIASIHLDKNGMAAYNRAKYYCNQVCGKCLVRFEDHGDQHFSAVCGGKR